MKKNIYAKTLLGVVILVVVVVGVSVINSFISPSDQQVPPQTSSNIEERGAALYSQYCLSCHGDQQAKPVLGQPPPHNSEGHTWHHADGELKKWILNGKPYNMPAFQQTLFEADVEAILAYIKTWWEPNQREVQASVSKQYEDMLEKYPQDP